MLRFALICYVLRYVFTFWEMLRFAAPIGLYREYAIAIENEGDDSIRGNVYYVTMQIMLPITEFTTELNNTGVET